MEREPEVYDKRDDMPNILAARWGTALGLNEFAPPIEPAPPATAETPDDTQL